MESVSLKLERNILGEIDASLLKHRYSTRTEFIRDAIREKLSELEKEDIFRNIAKLEGISKRKTTNEQLRIAREKAFEQLEKKFR